MRTIKWGGLALVAGLLSLFLLRMAKPEISVSQVENKVSSLQHDIGFPFEIIYEKQFENIPGWNSAISLAREHYSRENLEKLFRWYSKRHPDKHEQILLNITTNAEEFRREQMLDALYPHIVHEEVRGFTGLQAMFFRSYHSSQFADNEVYIYTPSLKRRGEEKRIILRGKDVSFSEDNIDEIYKSRV